MSSIQGFSPDWISAPGDTMADILRERNLSEADFAQRLGRTLSEARDLLQGRSAITIAIARRLEHVLGASVEFWMSRDFQYRQAVARLDVDRQEWLSELPVSDMIKFGWLSPIPRPVEEFDACLRFFNVTSVAAWRDVYDSLRQGTAFRTSPSFDSRPGAVAAWLRQGEVEAESINCDHWDVKRFEGSLAEVRSLTREKDPDRFLPKLQELCARSGVAVAVVRAPTGCRASGATRFLSERKALLQLSFRYLTDDHFWFTFFHEAGHLVLHGKKRLFLEGAGEPSTTEEEEANEFAARTLIPSEFKAAMLSLPVDGRKVIQFARRVGVSPGIVVGQLQHLGKFRRNQLNSLKRRFEWER